MDDGRVVKMTHSVSRTDKSTYTKIKN
jgi:hypothetical protein